MDAGRELHAGTDLDGATGLDAAVVPQIGMAVWTSDATAMVLELQSRGIGPYPPWGSECDGTERYSFAVANRELTWRECRPPRQTRTIHDHTERWQLREGRRILVDAEVQRLVGALEMVRRIDVPVCPSDYGVMGLFVTTPAGTIEYCYPCPGADDSAGEVDTVVPLFEEMALLVP